MNGLLTRARTCLHCGKRARDNEFFQFSSDRSVPESCAVCAVTQGIVSADGADRVVYARLRARSERRARERRAYSRLARAPATPAEREDLYQRFHRSLAPDEWAAWTANAEAEYLALRALEAARERWFRIRQTAGQGLVHDEAQRYYRAEFSAALVGPDSPDELLQRMRSEASLYALHCVRLWMADPARWWAALPPLGVSVERPDPRDAPWMSVSEVQTA